jgi:hypothetical protein
MAERTNTKHWIASYPKKNTGLDGASYAADLYDETEPDGSNPDKLVANAEGAQHLSRLVQPLGSNDFSSNEGVKLKWDRFMETDGNPDVPTFTPEIGSVRNAIINGDGLGTAPGGNTIPDFSNLEGQTNAASKNEVEAALAAIASNITAIKDDIVLLVSYCDGLKEVLEAHGLIAPEKGE